MALNIEELDDFVRFYSLLDKSSKKIFVRYWNSKFGKDIQPDINQHSELKPYIGFIDSFLSNPGIQQLSTGNQTIFGDITSRVFEGFSSLQNKLLSNSPYQEEEISFLNWQKQSTESFLKNSENLLKDIGKHYKNNEFNFSFFESEFENIKGSISKKRKEDLKQKKKEDGKPILEQGKEDLKQKNIESIEFNSKDRKDALIKEILDRWNALLEKKKNLHFLEELDKLRKKMCEELYKQIEQFKKLMEVLQPFTDEVGRLWGMSKGLWKNAGFEILAKYAELLEKEPELQKLAEMLGRMHQAEDELEEELISETIVKPVQIITHAGKSELVGVHESNDINNLLPIELALLNNPVTELVFYKKFAEKKLLSYQFIGHDWGSKEEERSKTQLAPKKNKRGPIIICVDTSGSMAGTPEHVAKVLCFAITRIALLEKRQCFLISFSTGISTLELTDLKKNLNELIRFLMMSFHGGTDATPAFREALRQLKTESYEKADVLMISDFIMAALDENTQESVMKAKENGTKFHSLVISIAGNVKALEIFDNNWIYHTRNYDSFKSVLRNVRNINSIEDKINLD